MGVKLNQHLQESMIFLAITDTQFLKLVAGRLNPEHLTDRMSETLYRLCVDYYMQFEEAPQDHFHDEVVRFLRGKDDQTKDEYLDYIEHIRGRTDTHKQYTLNRVGDFIKTRVREDALMEAAELLVNGKLEEHDLLLYKALQSGIPEEDLGLDYLNDLSNISDYSSDRRLVSTGMAALNKQIGGFYRGQLLVTLGGYKAGKTWWLMHLTKTALTEGRNVIYVSNEVSQKTLEKRFDMMYTHRGTQKHRIGQWAKYFKRNKKTGIIEGDGQIIQKLTEEDRFKTRRKIRKFGGGLRIKKYPMGQCSPHEIERYLNYLETYENFVADILIIDYLDIMNLGVTKTELRHQLNDAYIWAKGLADSRDILVATISQVTRQALKKEHVTMRDVAEDVRKAGNCDIMLAIGRNDLNVKCNMATMNVLANREGNQDCRCKFSLCYDLGQFCISSWIGDEVPKKTMDVFAEDNRGNLPSQEDDD